MAAHYTPRRRREKKTGADPFGQRHCHDDVVISRLLCETLRR